MNEHDELLTREQVERRYDRRGVLAAGATLAAAAYATKVDRAFGALAGSDASGTLHYYNWADYVNPKTYDAFTKATGVKVKKSFFISNEALLAKMKAGARGYDLAAPTGYMVSILVGEDRNYVPRRHGEVVAAGASLHLPEQRLVRDEERLLHLDAGGLRERRVCLRVHIVRPVVVVERARGV